MDNTRFSNRCKILVLFSDRYVKEPWAQGFFTFYSLGLSYAIGYLSEHLTLTDKGMEVVDEAWQSLCELLDIDYHGDYQTLAEMMVFSGAEELNDEG